ncbi:MAG: hypothetical protein K9J27_11570 [Bacteroidales bacterium]|nr:hypothetical protein [Bacteroidales bacterium]
MLVTTIDQFRRVLPNLDASWDSTEDLTIYIESAERWLKNEILGQELYDYLNTTSGTQEGEIYTLCRNVIVLHSYLLGQPDLDTIQTKQGLGVVNNQQFSPASRDRSSNLLENVKKRLDTEVEELIEYLEGSPQEYKDKWKGSPAHEKIFETLVYSSRDFSEYYEIFDNRRLFLKLRSDLKAVETTRLANEISQAYLDELRDKQKDGQLTEKETAILPRLKYADVYLAMASALYTERISIKDDTIELTGPNSAFTRSANRKIQQDFYRLGGQLINEVVTYLNDHIDEYPTYADSDVYARKTYDGWVNDDETDPMFVSPS